MMEYAAKAPTIPIPFSKLLKVVALVDDQDPQVRPLLERLTADSYDVEVSGRYDRDVSQDAAVGAYIVAVDGQRLESARKPLAQATESISTGLIFFDFLLDVPSSAGVTSDDVALELDWYMGWSVNDNFIVSFIAAVAEPGDAVEQSSGRTDTFLYGMIYAAYSF